MHDKFYQKNLWLMLIHTNIHFPGLLDLILTGLGNGLAGHVHACRNSGTCNWSKVNGEARELSLV